MSSPYLSPFPTQAPFTLPGARRQKHIAINYQSIDADERANHRLFADQVAESYSWNNGALRRFNETLKDALDANSILAPGRNGIWGKCFRGKGWEILDGDKRDILRDGVRPKL